MEKYAVVQTEQEKTASEAVKKKSEEPKPTQKKKGKK